MLTSRILKNSNRKIFDKKLSTFKIIKGLVPPSDAHSPKTSYDKKAKEDNINIFTNNRIMIF